MKNRYLIPFHYLYTFCFLCIVNAYSQDSYENDTLKKYTFSELSDKFYASKHDTLKAIIYANKYISKAQEINDTIEIGNGYYYLSDITKDSSHFLDYWNKVIDKTNGLKKNFYTGVSYLKIGDFHLQFGDKSIALEKYLQANKIIKNDSLKHIIINRIAMLKKRNGDVVSAILYYKKSYKYFKNKKKTSIVSPEYFSLLINLSIAYSSIKKHDSAYYFNDKLVKALKNKNDSIYNGYAIYNKGIIEFNKNNYNKAILNLKKSVPFLISDENYLALSVTFYRIALSYKKLNNQLKAIKYYLKIDSLFTKNVSFNLHQKKTFKYLITYFKNKNDKKQLEYINKYITIDSVLTARNANITKELTENFDIPNLLTEKKNIENRLKSRLTITKKWIIFISSLATLLLLFLIHQSRKRKLYKKRFLQLVKDKKSISKKPKSEIKKANNNIPSEIIELVLNSLQQFEKKKQFISSDITLTSLALDFNTNSKYLSQIINQYKNQSFSNYINELRINYTIEKLKEDARFRKYSIKAIAGEVGFNNSESFSKAFYKNTGIHPSYFIKELEKSKV